MAAQPPAPASPSLAALSVDQVLATLLAGARLRQSERAVLDSQAAVLLGGETQPVAGATRRPSAAADDEVLARLLIEVRQREFVHDPVAFSPRPGLGRLLVLLRKVVFKFLMRWYLHPVVQQQNSYNQAVSRLLGELVARKRDGGG